ncbi:MAG: 50S ribosomal protein L18 [Candidatus Omnitrophica bacterium]|nr:50S ribosomal protein L18 [Candidatus Omnitrophota bacterium]
MNDREAGRLRRHHRIRKKVAGTPEKPRLAVHRSHLHLYAQFIDDLSGKTLAACSTRGPGLRSEEGKMKGLEVAKRLGESIAQAAIGAGIKRAVFDRGGYPYHGRVKALAEAARSKGLEI